MTSFLRVLRSTASTKAPVETDATQAGQHSHTPGRVLRQPSISGLEYAPRQEAPVDVERDAYERGIEDGREAASQHLLSAFDTMQTALETARSRLRGEFERQRDELVVMAVDMASLIMGHAQHDGGHALLARLNDALKTLDDSDLIVSMNEIDLPIASEIDAKGIKVIADPALLPGEARVDGQWAKADLTWTTAQTILREDLLQ